MATISNATAIALAGGVYSRVSNLEPSPKVVRFANRMHPAPIGSAIETAALYIRVQNNEPYTSPTHECGIYLEVGSQQLNTEGPAFKTIHRGAGDAQYTACFNSGPGYEVAAFYNGVSNIISTCQWEGSDTAARNFANTVLFGTVRGDDGTGGARDATAYGDFYAARSLGHSFRTRLQDPAATGWAWGRIEWGVSTFDLARYMIAMTNHGQATFRSRISTAGSPQFNDAFVGVSSSKWSGAANVDYRGYMFVDAAGGSAILVYKAGVEGSEAETWRCDAGGNPTFQGSTLRIVTRRTPASSAEAGNDGDFCFDSGYLYWYAGGGWLRAAGAAF